MNSIQYKTGDLFEVIKDGFDGITYIPHIVNTYGYWASGFVVPVAKFLPEAKMEYDSLFKKFKVGEPNEDMLGNTQMIYDDSREFCVVNMFAQLFGCERPIKYNALVKCMEYIFDDIWCFYGINESRIIAPKFGSLRAGGNWDFIEKLIEDTWTSRGLDVTIVSFDEQKAFSKSQQKRISSQAGNSTVLECEACCATDKGLIFFDGDNKFYCRECYNLADRGIQP